MSNIYFDHAATSPLRPEVIDRMTGLIQENLFGNPSSTHSFGRKAKTVVEEARRAIAERLHAQNSEITFTSGGTEADNMALYLSIRDLKVEQIITSPIEHHAILHTAEALSETYNIPLHLVNVNEHGDIDINHLEQILKNGKKSIVSLMHANNEIGNLLDLKKVGDLVHQYEGYFHSDTVQTIGHQEFDLSELPVDMLSAAAHKFNGPKGVGFFYAKTGLGLKPFINGGAQERGMRGGTENVFSIAGMHTALDCAYNDLAEERRHLESLKSYFIEKLKENFPEVIFNGRSGELDKSNFLVLSVTFPHLTQDPMFLFNMDIRGIAVSGGSACSSGSNKGSHVLTAIRPDKDWPAIRFSFGLGNTKDEVDAAIKALQEIMQTAQVG